MIIYSVMRQKYIILNMFEIKIEIIIFGIMFQDYIPSINMECQYSNNSIYVEDMADLRRSHVTFWSNGS